MYYHRGYNDRTLYYVLIATVFVLFRILQINKYILSLLLLSKYKLWEFNQINERLKAQLN